jgi:hypothetical protein
MSGIVTSNILDSTGLIKTSSVAVGLTFISKQTASSSSTLSFTSGIDSTFKEYIFYFKGIHPSDAGTNFRVDFSVNGGSSYGAEKTTTVFAADHFESGSSASLATQSGQDLAASTNPQMFMILDTANDSGGAGYLHLFEPSSDTFVKNFIIYGNGIVVDGGNPKNFNMYVSGYANVTSPVNAVQFSMAGGTIDAGEICLYGLTK